MTTIESHEVPFSQIELISAICKHLNRQTKAAFRGRILTILPRQMNSIINAANAILAELSRPYRPAVPGSGYEAWLMSDDTGLSSQFMGQWFHELCSRSSLEIYHPRNADDFDRCLKFVEACPHVKPRLHELEQASPAWESLVNNWGELEDLLRTDRRLCSQRISELTGHSAEPQTPNDQ